MTTLTELNLQHNAVTSLDALDGLSNLQTLDVSYNALTTDEFNGEDILIAEQPDVCDTVVESIMTDKLRKAILKLTDEEQLLIYRHYYAGISGTDLAEIYGVSQQAISKRIAKIRAKLKNLLEKFKDIKNQAE